MNLVNRVRDTLRPVVLDITQADIDAAHANADRTMNCPAQRAAARLFAPVTVTVGSNSVLIHGGSKTRRIFRSLELAAFTSVWDASTYDLDRDRFDLTAGVASPARIRLYRTDTFV